MVNTCGEIGLCTPCTDATPSAEGVASVHGVQTSISPQVLTKDSRPPPLSHQCTSKLSSLVKLKLIPAVTAMALAGALYIMSQYKGLAINFLL